MSTPRLFGKVGGRASGLARERRAAFRRAEVLCLLQAGMSPGDCGRALGVTLRTIYRDMSELDESRQLTRELIEDAGLDADDLHITLSKMHDADLSDIVENPEAPIEQLRFKPIAQWPPIWRQGLAGKIKIIPVAVSDGERTEGGDPQRFRVEVERAELLKILELAAKLKAVDAMASLKPGDTNILVVTAETARKVVSARKRLAAMDDASTIDVSVTDTSRDEP